MQKQAVGLIYNVLVISLIIDSPCHVQKFTANVVAATPSPDENIFRLHLPCCIPAFFILKYRMNIWEMVKQMVSFCSNGEDFHWELLHRVHVKFSLLLHHCYWWYNISACAGVGWDAVQDWQGWAALQTLRISVGHLAQSGSVGLQKAASGVALSSSLCNSRHC